MNLLSVQLFVEPNDFLLTPPQNTGLLVLQCKAPYIDIDSATLNTHFRNDSSVFASSHADQLT